MALSSPTPRPASPGFADFPEFVLKTRGRPRINGDGARWTRAEALGNREGIRVMSGPGTKIRIREIGPHRHRHRPLIVPLVHRAGRHLGDAGGPGRRNRGRRVEGRRGVEGGRLHPRYPADPGRQVLPVPRARRPAAQGEAAARQPSRRHGPGGLGQPGDRARQARRERALSADHRRRSRGADAAGQQQEVALARRGRAAQGVDRAGRRVPRALGVRPAGPARGPRGQGPRLVPQPDRLLRPRPPRGRGTRALARGRQGHPASAGSASTSSACRRRSQEVDAFLADTRHDAYARLVDRLLDSPHYGERWGRIWLDAARYADSDGYEKDKSRQVFAYRDWVIRRPQPRPALQPVHRRADRRRPAPGRRAGSGRRHGLPPQLDDQRGGRRRSRAVPHGGDVRPHGLHRQGRAGPDHPVRPVP